MSILTKIKKKLAHYTWDLAYGEYTDDIIENGLKCINLHIIKNPFKKKWFADPFILKETKTELHLLVEEFDSDIRRGRIAHLIIDKSKDIIINYKIILDIPTHLSFPAIYSIENKIYVHPENYQSGKSFVYEYDLEENSLKEPVALLNEPVADAIIFKKGDSYVMSATLSPNVNGSELLIYESNNFFGPYELKSKQIYPNNTARMGGMYFEHNGILIRPAQDCSDAYGKAIVFYNDNKQVGRLDPPNYKYCGLHTFNVKENTFIIDLKKRDYPFLYLILKNIKHIL